MIHVSVQYPTCRISASLIPSTKESSSLIVVPPPPTHTCCNARGESTCKCRSLQVQGEAVIYIFAQASVAPIALNIRALLHQTKEGLLLHHPVQHNGETDAPNRTGFRKGREARSHWELRGRGHCFV